MAGSRVFADLIVRAGTVQLLAQVGSAVREVAVRDGTVIALASRPGQLDGLRGPDTRVLGDPRVTVLPAFVDTHNHLMLAARNVLRAPTAGARTVEDLLASVRERAGRTPVGDWVVTAGDWHEIRLAERRMPTAAELDSVAPRHPVLLARGVHNGVLNSVGLRLAGVDPAGNGATGHVGGLALERALRLVPPTPIAALVEGLAKASARYAARGIGTVRDPAVTPDDWQAYLAAGRAGRLAVRGNVMIASSRAAIDATGSMDAYLDGLTEAGIRPGGLHRALRVWGLKLFLDGGTETAALCGHYAGRPDFTGTLNWAHDELVEVLTTAVRRGWPVGIHALGDRAVGALVEAVRAVQDRAGQLPDNGLVIEHGGLCGSRIADIASLGLPVTAQFPLVDGLAEAFVAEWGRERVSGLFPLRDLIDAGVAVSAGTDHPVAPLDPLRAVYGMTTRRTSIGTFGREQAIGRFEALRLSTAAGARFLGDRPPLTLGAPADLVGYRDDPMVCAADELLRIEPAFTVVGGRIEYEANRKNITGY